MKKIASLLVLLILSAQLNAQMYSKKIKGNGNVVTVKRTTQDYDGISVGGSFDVILVKGKEGNITIEGEELEFSGGFTDLHTVSYQEIIAGKGYGLEAPRQAIEIVHDVRHSTPIGAKGNYHPFVKKPLANHPFEK